MTRQRRQPQRRALAMIEAVVSTVIVALMLAAALRTVAASGAGQVRNSDALRGHHLGMDLMAEILDLSYSDPDGLALFGQELGEVLGARDSFDDVDDYHNWSQDPPKQRDGSSMSGLGGWSRSVEVYWVSPSDPGARSLVETNAKLVIVTVWRRGVPVARLSAVRTAAAPR